MYLGAVGRNSWPVDLPVALVLGLVDYLLQALRGLERAALAFPGDLLVLHGVLPARRHDDESAAARVTFMVGFWGPGDTLAAASTRAPAPNMRPAAEGASPGSPFRAARSTRDAGDASQREIPLPEISPVWSRVPAGDPDAFGDLARGAVAFPGRFFLRRGPADIDDEIRALSTRKP